MKIFFACLLILFCNGAYSQAASFSTGNLRLEIPYLTVNRSMSYEDVELMLNDEGTAFELVDFKKRPLEWNGQRNITLAYGESAVVDGAFTITFRGVFSDNRCPSDVTCITGGEGVVIFALDELLGSGLTRQTLFGLSFTGLASGDLTDRETPAHEFRGLYFTPLVLAPYPVSTETIAEEDYEVIVQVSAIPGSCFPDGC